MDVIKFKTREDVIIKRLTMGGSRRFRDSVKGINLTIISDIFNSSENDNLTMPEFGMKILEAVGLDSPEIIIGLIRAFTDLPVDEIDELTPADCIKIIKVGIEANEDVIKDFLASIKNLFAPPIKVKETEKTPEV